MWTSTRCCFLSVSLCIPGIFSYVEAYSRRSLVSGLIHFVRCFLDLSIFVTRIDTLLFLLLLSIVTVSHFMCSSVDGYFDHFYFFFFKFFLLLLS